MRRWSDLAAPAMLSGYLIWPVSRWGAFAGRPLSPATALALAVVWIVWACTGRPRGWRMALALLVLKAGGGALMLEHGFQAQYFANADWRAPVERGLEHPAAAYTRVDPVLDFVPGTRDVPLFFHNDLRFNFYGAHDPERHALPYSAVWTGWLQVAGDGPLRIYLRAPGVAAGRVSLDGFPVTAVPSDGAQAIGSLNAREGLRRVRIEVSAPYATGREISAGLVDSHDRFQPFEASTVFTERASWQRV